MLAGDDQHRLHGAGGLGLEVGHGVGADLAGGGDGEDEVAFADGLADDGERDRGGLAGGRCGAVFGRGRLVLAGAEGGRHQKGEHKQGGAGDGHGLDPLGGRRESKGRLVDDAWRGRRDARRDGIRI